MEALENTIYYDKRLKRYYNAEGVWVDRIGRLMPHRGVAGQYRSKGIYSKCNRNPGGPGANPPHVHARFGERSRLQGPPEAAEAARGDPWPAGSRPGPARSRPSDWSSNGSEQICAVLSLEMAMRCTHR